MHQYRVFIGMWDEGEPGWTRLDVAGLSWEDARKLLAEHLGKFEDDDCEVCKTDAKEELSRLTSASAGKFEAAVDGEDYLILDDAH